MSLFFNFVYVNHILLLWLFLHKWENFLQVEYLLQGLSHRRYIHLYHTSYTKDEVRHQIHVDHRTMFPL